MSATTADYSRTMAAPCGTPLFSVINTTMFGSIAVRDIFVGVAIGLIMHHYFVDQFIWRPSKDAQLRHDLQVGAR